MALGSMAILWLDQGISFFQSGLEAFNKHCQKEVRENRKLAEMKNIISCPPEKTQTYGMSLLKRFDNVLPFFCIETKAIQSSDCINRFLFHKELCSLHLTKCYSTYESLCPK